MCFYIDSSNPFSKMTFKDIIVYKEGYNITRDRFECKFQEFTYEKDKDNPEVELNINRELTNDVINKGYHSYIYREGNVSDVGIFVIPKGAIYYESRLNRKQRVSSKLIYLGPYSWRNRLKLRLGIKI